MKPMFFESDHTYVDEFGKEYEAVTKVCSITPKHTDFRKLKNQAAVERAIEIGKDIHVEIENFIKKGEEGNLPSTKHFIKEIYPKFKNWRSEVLIYSDEDTTSFAGHIDLVADELDDSGWVILDVKSGSYNTVDYQEALYKRGISKMEGKDPTKCKLYVLPIDKKNLDKKLQIKPVRVIPDAWIDNLLACYKVYMETGRNNYKEPAELPEGIAEDLVKQIEGLDIFIAKIEQQTKLANDRQKALHQQLYEAMDKFDVKEFDFGVIHATRVIPAMKEVFDEQTCKEENKDVCDSYNKEIKTIEFDMEAFQKDHPELVKKYTSTKESRRGYVKISIKEDALLEEDEDGQI